MQSEAQTNHTQYHQYEIAADLGETVLQGFAHRFKHILQGADTGKHHGGVQNYRKELAKGNILQNTGQSYKQQGGACAHIQIVGEAGGDNHQRSNQCGNGIKHSGTDRNMNHIFLVIQISAVDDHAAAGNGQREKCLAHSPDPYHRVL